MRAQANEDWSLFCPNEAPGLCDCWGEEFEALYKRYESEGRAKSKMPAQQLWFSVLDSQIETGTPYMLYKVSYAHLFSIATVPRTHDCPDVVRKSSL